MVYKVEKAHSFPNYFSRQFSLNVVCRAFSTDTIRFQNALCPRCRWREMVKYNYITNKYHSRDYKYHTSFSLGHPGVFPPLSDRSNEVYKNGSVEAVLGERQQSGQAETTQAYSFEIRTVANSYRESVSIKRTRAQNGTQQISCDHHCYLSSLVSEGHV